mmetsp:Transcript_24660/g.45495  ORF Transcript_24660/g.45495 Transcript_24660/m.45495 type:complete len:201 (+) Transcript_24660:382-984(+)
MLLLITSAACRCPSPSLATRELDLHDAWLVEDVRIDEEGGLCPHFKVTAANEQPYHIFEIGVRQSLGQSRYPQCPQCQQRHTHVHVARAVHNVMRAVLERRIEEFLHLICLLVHIQAPSLDDVQGFQPHLCIWVVEHENDASSPLICSRFLICDLLHLTQRKQPDDLTHVKAAPRRNLLSETQPHAMNCLHLELHISHLL